MGPCPHCWPSISITFIITRIDQRGSHKKPTLWPNRHDKRCEYWMQHKKMLLLWYSYECLNKAVIISYQVHEKSIILATAVLIRPNFLINIY